MIPEVREAIEKLGWQIYKNEDPEIEWTPDRGYILEAVSPLGEHLYVTVSDNGKIVEELLAIAHDFDAVEHVREIIKGGFEESHTIQEL